LLSVVDLLANKSPIIPFSLCSSFLKHVLSIFDKTSKKSETTTAKNPKPQYPKLMLEQSFSSAHSASQMSLTKVICIHDSIS